MKLSDLFRLESEKPSLWREKYKIPWHDPDFSARMLQEHLSQEHDLASRRKETIDSHVVWIHGVILDQVQSRILDLGCGPGFYCERLAAVGHRCRGIDFSPAAIAYARANTAHADSCEYILGDIRSESYGSDYDLALIVYGEFNVFPRLEAEKILEKIRGSLRPGGTVLIEAHTFDAVRRIGCSENTWYKAETGLFSTDPHICLIANRWHAPDRAAESQYFLIEADSGSVTLYRNVIQAYSLDDYRLLLQSAGFERIEILPAWGKPRIEVEDNHLLLRARR